MRRKLKAAAPVEVFDALFHESVIPAWFIDLDTMAFLDVNSSAIEKYGYQRDTFLNSDLRLLRPNDTVEQLSSEYCSFADEPGLYPRKHRRADGQWINVEVSVRHVKFQEKRAVVAQILDVDSLQSVQAQIARAQHRIDRILEGSFDAVVSIDRDSKIVEWSGVSEQLFGWTKEEALERRLHELIMPERFVPLHLEALHKYYVTGSSNILDTTVRVSALHKEGHEFPVDLRITRVDRFSTFDFTAFIRPASESTPDPTTHPERPLA